jgi:hypothetical protein
MWQFDSSLHGGILSDACGLRKTGYPSTLCTLPLAVLLPGLTVLIVLDSMPL